VLNLHLNVFLPKEYVVVRNEVGDEMYFIQNGNCEVTIPFKDMPKEKQDFISQERLKDALLEQEKKTRPSVNNSVNGLMRRGSNTLGGGRRRSTPVEEEDEDPLNEIERLSEGSGGPPRKSSLMEMLRRKSKATPSDITFNLPPIDANKEQVLATLNKGR
tara:strand:- start:25 stop:504 length:480 start_codon:yes stop_codon:yes gene_type:complete